MTDLTMTAATRTFTAHAGHTPRGLAAAIRHLPLLAVTALLSVAILSAF